LLDPSCLLALKEKSREGRCDGNRHTLLKTSLASYSVLVQYLQFCFLLQVSWKHRSRASLVGILLAPSAPSRRRCWRTSQRSQRKRWTARLSINVWPYHDPDPLGLLFFSNEGFMQEERKTHKIQLGLTHSHVHSTVPTPRTWYYDS